MRLGSQSEEQRSSGSRLNFPRDTLQLLRRHDSLPRPSAVFRSAFLDSEPLWSSADLLVRRGQRRGRSRRLELCTGPSGAATEAAVQLHRAHRHGHQERTGSARNAQRHLPVHHGPVPFLSRQQAGLAELNPPQPLTQRLLHQGAQRERPARQRQLLDAGHQVLGYV